MSENNVPIQEAEAVNGEIITTEDSQKEAVDGGVFEEEDEYVPPVPVQEFQTTQNDHINKTLLSSFLSRINELVPTPNVGRIETDEYSDINAQG